MDKLSRSLQQELCDKGMPANICRAQAMHLHYLNIYTGNFWIIKKLLSPVLVKKSSVKILDVGTGIADLPRYLSDRLSNLGIKVHIVGIDTNPQIIAMAEEYARKYPNIELHSRALKDLDGQEYDIATLSQVLHHLEPTEVVEMLKQLKTRVKQVIVISDLIRSRASYWFVKVLAYATAQNPVTRHDAPLSVLRAYSEAEILNFFDQAGITNFKIYNFFPRKFIVIRF